MKIVGGWPTSGFYRCGWTSDGPIVKRRTLDMLLMDHERAIVELWPGEHWGPLRWKGDHVMDMYESRVTPGHPGHIFAEYVGDGMYRLTNEWPWFHAETRLALNESAENSAESYWKRDQSHRV
jgi:hypothetical protein